MFFHASFYCSFLLYFVFFRWKMLFQISFRELQACKRWTRSDPQNNRTTILASPPKRWLKVRSASLLGEDTHQVMYERTGPGHKSLPGAACNRCFFLGITSMNRSQLPPKKIHNPWGAFPKPTGDLGFCAGCRVPVHAIASGVPCGARPFDSVWRAEVNAF